MSYSTFRLGANDATKEPMFLGQSVNVARYDQQKYRDFEKLIEKQLSFFWRPEEVDITTDRIDFNTKLQEHERHIFLQPPLPDSAGFRSGTQPKRNAAAAYFNSRARNMGGNMVVL